MLTKSQIDKLGRRLEAGNANEADLEHLEAYRRLAHPAYATALAELKALGLEPTGRPSKSTRSIIEKLRRESCRLSQIQDMAGCRVVVVNTRAQDAIVATVANARGSARTVDRRIVPSNSYRAVHVVLGDGPVPIEIQVRTKMQHAWAELSEKLADKFGSEVKYGGGPDSIRSLLSTFSGAIQKLEEGEAQSTQLERAIGELQETAKDFPNTQIVEKVDLLVVKLREKGEASRIKLREIQATLLDQLARSADTFT